MKDRSQRKKLVVMVILVIILLLISFMQFQDKVLTLRSSIATDHSGDALGADANALIAFDAWRTTIPQIEWQKPEIVKSLKRDPMVLDMSTVRIEIPKPHVQTYDNFTDVNTTGLISVENPKFLVNGIVFSKETTSSIIVDDRILQAGDSIFGAVITKIFEHSVEFEMNGKRWTVNVGERSEKSK